MEIIGTIVLVIIALMVVGFIVWRTVKSGKEHGCGCDCGQAKNGTCSGCSSGNTDDTEKNNINRVSRFQTDSVEDYLKTIALLGAQSKPIRVQDISRSLNIKPSSVSEALNKLVNAGLVRHPKHGRVELTTEGTLIAEDICLRYELLHRLLVEILGVPTRIAEKDACGMEHALSQTSRERLEKLVNCLSKHPLIAWTSIR
jgi:DtxR family Mn-dependent transcriptional regulator